MLDTILKLIICGLVQFLTILILFDMDMNIASAIIIGFVTFIVTYLIQGLHKVSQYDSDNDKF